MNRLDQKGTKLNVLFGGHQAEKRYCLCAFGMIKRKNSEHEHEKMGKWELH